MQKFLFRVITIVSVLVLIGFLSLELLLTPLTIDILYTVSNLAPDAYGWSNEQRLHLARSSARVLKAKVSINKDELDWSWVVDNQNIPIFSQNEVDHLQDVIQRIKTFRT